MSAPPGWYVGLPPFPPDPLPQPGWWALILSRIAASFNKLQTAIVGNYTNAGTIATTQVKPATSLVGAMQPAGTVVTQQKPITTALAGAQVQGGAIASQLLLPSTALVGGQTDIGNIASTLFGMSSAASGLQTDVATIATSQALLVSAMSGVELPSGVISVVQPQLVSQIVGGIPTQGVIATALQQISTALIAGEIEQGTIAATMAQVSTNLAGAQQQSGTMATALLQAITAIAGGVVTPAVAFDAAGAGAKGASALTTTLTVAGNYLVCFVIHSSSSNPTVNAKASGGSNVAMTALMTPVLIGNLSGFNAYITCFGLANPPTGAGVTVTTSSLSNAGSMDALSFNNVVSVSASNTGAQTGTATQTVTTTDSTQQVAQAFGGTNGNFSAYNKTSVYNASEVNFQNWATQIGYATAGTGSTTFSATHSGVYVGAAVVLSPT